MLAAAACVAQLMGEHDATGAGVFAAVVDGAEVVVLDVANGAKVVSAVVDGSLVLVLGSAVDGGSTVVELSPSA